MHNRGKNGEALGIMMAISCIMIFTKNCQNAPPLAVGMNGKLSIKLPALSETYPPLGVGIGPTGQLYFYSIGLIMRFFARFFVAADRKRHAS